MFSTVIMIHMHISLLHDAHFLYITPKFPVLMMKYRSSYENGALRVCNESAQFFISAITHHSSDSVTKMVC